MSRIVYPTVKTRQEQTTIIVHALIGGGGGGVTREIVVRKSLVVRARRLGDTCARRVRVVRKTYGSSTVPAVYGRYCLLRVGVLV